MEKIEILALSLAKEISNSELLYFIENFDSIDEIRKSSFGKEFEAKFDKVSLFDKNHEFFEKANNQLEIARKSDSEIIDINDSKYPELLKNITHPPPLIFIRGNLLNADNVSISIVGTRKATNYGRLVVEKFVSQFLENNVIITSGLAYGIDSYAHEQALNNKGITYAVIASGLDKISTDRAIKLSDKIVDKDGCIISTFPFGTNALPPYFISRNRIISGISKATIIIESAAKGGSLWTAKFAVEQNRDLFAVPGNIFEPKCKGTNELIDKEMARPALSAEQILKQIGFSKVIDTSSDKPIVFSNSDEEQIYNILSFTPTHIDEIANKSALPIASVAIGLLNLEFNLLVRQLPGKLYIRNTN